MSGNANPEMLILARELRQVTQTHLAEISGVDQGTISRYEGGLRPISDIDLELFARALGFPIAFFYRPGKRLGTESGELFHRKRRSVPARLLSRVDAHLNRFRLDVTRLLEVADVESPFNIPSYSVQEYNDIELIAAAVRSAWKMPPGPVSNLTKILEDAFCFIHVHDFGTDQIDETVQWVEPLPPIILINQRAPGDRLRFTLAHALGHLVMHHDLAPHAKMEEEADQFASAFLMPKKDIKSELKPVTIEHMLQLKPAWKVSMQALIRRAKDIGVINDRRYQSLFQMLSRAGYRKIEPFPLPAERPTLFRKLLHLYQNDLGYSTTELAEVLAICEDDFWDWYLPDRPRLKLVNTSSVRPYTNRATGCS